jgi:hypothetical protein
MNISIEIADLHTFYRSIYIGLRVKAKRRRFPVVVGCSVRSLNGEVSDQPVRELGRPGYAYWGQIEAPDECYLDDERLAGQVTFALYSDITLSERLADTGWTPWNGSAAVGVAWEHPWLTNESQAGMRVIEADLKSRYGEALAWPDT